MFYNHLESEYSIADSLQGPCFHTHQLYFLCAFGLEPSFGFPFVVVLWPRNWVAMTKRRNSSTSVGSASTTATEGDLAHGVLTGADYNVE